MSRNLSNLSPAKIGNLSVIGRVVLFLRFQLIFCGFVLLSIALMNAGFFALRGIIIINSVSVTSLTFVLGLIFTVYGLNITYGLFYRTAIFIELLSLLLAFALNLFIFGPLTPILNILTVFLYIINSIGTVLVITVYIAGRSARNSEKRNGSFLSQFVLTPRKIVFPSVSKLKKIVYTIVLVSVIVLPLGSIFNWGYTITVRAPDNFKTVSSYWGPPLDDRVSAVRKITPLDNTTLLVSNSTLNASVHNMGEGSFCYVDYVKIHGSDKNYCNYSAGAMSFPNGTVILSEPLPNTSDVEIKFVYRYNIDVFRMLGETNATLIINYLNEQDDFIYYPNIFERITRTYLFQLFDYWHIKYYLDIGLRSYSFPHIFNYKPFVKFANDTITWASIATEGVNGSKALKYMVGISADFESSDPEVPEYNPLQNPDLKPPIGLVTYRDWIGLNEQNETLYEEAWRAWENVYDYCAEKGFKFYAVFQTKAMYDTVDFDLDISRLPTYPISDNDNVLYGIMNYKDSKFDGGRYAVYEDSINQIKLYGDKGKTLLMGWIAKGTKYYTDDEIGLERYIEDCLIAQAAGIEEIFHAPLYRMQGKWGNDTILKLHKALNEEPKRTFYLRAQTITDFSREYFPDYIKNWNRPIYAVPLWILGLLISWSSAAHRTFTEFSAEKIKDKEKERRDNPPEKA